MEEKFSALMRSSEGFIFFVIKGISWGFVKLNACRFLVLISHLGDRLNLFLLLNLSHWRPINQHTHTHALSFGFLSRKCSWGRCESSFCEGEDAEAIQHCAECPSGISPHYGAMRAKNTNRKGGAFLLLHLFFYSRHNGSSFCRRSFAISSLQQ